MAGNFFSGTLLHSTRTNRTPLEEKRFKNGVNAVFAVPGAALLWPYSLQRRTAMSKRILVADDSDLIRRVVHSYLAERDFDVCGEAVDGEDAIEKARELKPDLILLDLAMPRTNGIEAASVLKNMMPNVQIILFTLYSEAVGKTFPREELAVDAVIDKAHGMDRLEECIQRLLRANTPVFAA
jgi:CheY-like chemotaxis protein